MNQKLISIANKLHSALTKDDIEEIYKDIKLSSSYDDGQLVILWNSWGMLYLIIFLLESLKKERRDHFHFDEFNWLEKWSIELIFDKID